MQRHAWTEPYSAMFRSSSAAAAPPQRQPLLESNQQKVSPPKKSLASGLRSLLFHGGEESPEHHTNGDHGAESPQSPPMKSGPPTKIKQVVPEFVPPKAVSPPSHVSHVKKGNPRDTFHRSNSHPIRLDASAALSASRSFDPSMTRAAALDPSSLQTSSRSASGDPSQQSQQPQAAPSLRSTVFGSCSHVLSTVVGVLFQIIKEHREFIRPPIGAELASANGSSSDGRVRKAKLLYITLLEKAQKERGEWQGFGSRDTNQQSNDQLEDEQEQVEESAADVLLAALEDVTKEDGFALLQELLELSFRNLRVSLVTPAVYSKHKRELAKESLVSPVSLTTLLRVGSFVNDLNRDEKSCLLRLLTLWYARCLVDPEQQEIRSIIEERFPLILNECSEVEFMQQVTRKSTRLDPVAIDLLMVMAQHRELIFSDVELYSIRREMQLTPLLPPLEEEELDDYDEVEQLEVEHREETRSTLEEGDAAEQVVDDLFQDASSQVDLPVNIHVGTQVDAVQSQHCGIQVASCDVQDASTQVQVDYDDRSTQAEVDSHDSGTQVEVDNNEQAIQTEDTVDDDLEGCLNSLVPVVEARRSVGSQAAAVVDPVSKFEVEPAVHTPPEAATASLALAAVKERDLQFLNESAVSTMTISLMAAPTQLCAASDEPKPASKRKKGTPPNRLLRKTRAGANSGRLLHVMNPVGKAERSQVCDSNETKYSRAVTFRGRTTKKKPTPKIAVPLKAGTHHIHTTVSHVDKATEVSPTLVAVRHEAATPYAYVGLSIAAAAFGAVATIALQTIRKPGL